MKKSKTKKPSDAPQGVVHALFQFVWRLSPLGRLVAVVLLLPIACVLSVWLLLPEQEKSTAFHTKIAPAVASAFRNLMVLVTPGSRPPVLDLTKLCAVERRLVANAETRGEPGGVQDLAAYYRHANLELFTRLDFIVKTSQSTERHFGVTYIMGAPGIGKSYVLRGLQGVTVQMKLKSFFETNPSHLGISERHDLVTRRARVFNALLTIANPGGLTLGRLLDVVPNRPEAKARQLILIDDLDEVHGEASNAVLKAVDAYVRGHPDKEFVHVVIAGRPEAFADRLTDPHRAGPGDLRDFLLLPPGYPTDRALRLLAHNVLSYKGRRPTDNATVAFVQLVRSHPFLTYTIGTLAIAEVVVEHAVLNPGLGAGQLQSLIYDSILERNHKTHGRPRANTADYDRILEDIAARYASAVDDKGGFIVGFLDEVSIVDADGREIDTVRVRDTLDRSGVAVLDPVDFKTRRYTFHPFWVHMHLIERRNVRLHKTHQPRTCESIGRPQA